MCNLLFALFLPLLPVCAKPVAWYAAHPTERQARVQACLASSDNDNEDCRNAAQAEFDAMGTKAVNGRAVAPDSKSK
jgi:hypothetical protein